jgi:transcriptional regulator with XRE-family HTH domain
MPFGPELKKRRIARGWTQDVAAENLGISSKTVSRLENGQAMPKLHHIASLKREFGFTQSELEEYLLPSNATYTSFESKDVILKYGNFHAFLEHLIKMDYSALSYYDDKFEGTADFWAPIFEEDEYTWGALAKNGDVIGYWSFLVLNDEAFEKTKNGKLIEPSLTNEDLAFMYRKGRYKIYVSMVILDENYRTPAAFDALLNNFSEKLEKLARDGFFISDVCAYAVKSDTLARSHGVRLCAAMGMKEVGKSLQDESVFYMDGKDISEKGLLSRNSAVRDMYAREFSQTD